MANNNSVNDLEGVSANESIGGGARDGIVLVKNVGDEGTPYVSPVDAKIQEDFDQDGDANDGSYAVKFSGGRSDRA